MVQVQLAYSHKNKKRLNVLAKCASFVSLCSWELSKGKDGKEEAPGREVETRNYESECQERVLEAVFTKAAKLHPQRQSDWGYFLHTGEVVSQR